MSKKKFKARQVTLNGAEVHIAMAVLRAPGKGTDHNKAAEILDEVEDFYDEKVKPFFQIEPGEEIDWEGMTEDCLTFDTSDRVVKWLAGKVKDSNHISLLQSRQMLSLQDSLRKAKVVELEPGVVRDPDEEEADGEAEED